jgi:hypothetical protein
MKSDKKEGKAIGEMGSKELVELHNRHAEAAGARPLKKWGGKLSDLRVRVSAVVAAAEEASRPKAASAGKRQRGPGVGAYVRELFAQGMNDTNQILAAVAARFPDAATSAKCVRWYASKEGVSLHTARAPKADAKSA